MAVEGLTQFTRKSEEMDTELEAKSGEEPDWTHLPSDMIVSVALKVRIFSDYVRLRAVHSGWRSSVPATPTHLPFQFPWLMFYQSGWQCRRRGFYDPLSRKVHFLSLPDASQPRRICCSSNGWLVVLEEGPGIFCLNPLTRARVSLPPLSSFPNVTSFDFCNVGREYTVGDRYGNVRTRNLKQMRDTFLKKIIFSDSPGNGRDFVALAMLNFTEELALCKKGDASWKFLPGTACFYEDVVYSNGLFYGLASTGHLYVIDPTAARVSIVDTLSPLTGDLQYLLHSGDKLFSVCRRLEVPHNEPDIDVYETTRFEVFRLDDSQHKWELVDDMENQVIFLGKNASLLLSVSDFPGCKGNRVYFTDDHSEYNYDVAPPCYDMGIFNLQDNSIEKLPYFVHTSVPAFALPAPMWVSPNPC